MRTVELDELTAALAGPRPDRATVLASFHRKHRRTKAKRRLWWASGFAACLVVALAIVTTTQSRPHSSVTTSPSPAGCSPAPLAQSLAQAQQAGASILLAYGSPTGQTAGTGYQAVVLSSVRMLSGPVIASGTTAWTDGTAISAGTGPAAGGPVLAIAWPAAVAGSAVGPIVHTAPVVGGNVILTRSGCGDVANLAALPNPGPGMLPPSREPATDGLYALPLRVVEQAVARPLPKSRKAAQQAVPTPTSSPSPGPSPSPSQGNGNGNSGNGNGTASSGAGAGNGDGNGSGQSKGNGNGAGNGSGQSNGKVKGKGNGNGNSNG
jgi:hypothetical protein